MEKEKKEKDCCTPQAMKPCSYTQILLPVETLLSISVISEVTLEIGKTVDHDNAQSYLA